MATVRNRATTEFSAEAQIVIEAVTALDLHRAGLRSLLVQVVVEVGDEPKRVLISLRIPLPLDRTTL